MINQLFEKLSEYAQVEAIALGGSRSGENYDEKSDYDVLMCMFTSLRQSEKKADAHYWLITANIWRLETITGNTRITAF